MRKVNRKTNKKERFKFPRKIKLTKNQKSSKMEHEIKDYIDQIVEQDTVEILEISSGEGSVKITHEDTAINVMCRDRGISCDDTSETVYVRSSRNRL